MRTDDPISLRRAIAELERWAAEMVLWFKPQVLPLPVITVQTTSQRALGWFAWSRWETRDGAILNEINFVPEYLGNDVFDIAETLMHELIHLANYTAGIRDCSSNQYHNSHFRDRALSMGLTCERMAPFGWAKTGLTPVLRQRIAEIHPDAGAFDLFRLPSAPVPGAVPVGTTRSGVEITVHPHKKKLAKWSCDGRCASAWVATGTELRAECLECRTRLCRI